MPRFLFAVWGLWSMASSAAGLLGPWPIDTGRLSDSNPTAPPSPFGRTPPERCSDTVLHDGMQLPPAPELYAIFDPDKAWGTPEMLEAIVAGSEEVAWQLPHADPIAVGDISRKKGGYFPPHVSHRSGMDADLGIFTGSGRQPTPRGFTTVTPNNIDYKTNWTFWSRLLETGLVDRILLDQSLIDAMRHWLISARILSSKRAHEIFPKKGTPRLWARQGIFQHASGHRNHIHLRVLCGLAN